MAEEVETKFRAVIQYRGTRYHGWQIQKDRSTIQGQLVEVLSRLAGRRISVVGASRTDSGVHALGQVAHFRFPFRPTIPDLQKALKALLPSDIRILALKPAAAEFHAQRHALKKRYCYRIFTGQVLSPFETRQVHHLAHPLNLEGMQQAAGTVIGEHDFTSFAASSCSVKSSVRRIFRSDFVKRGHYYTYRVEANGFLHHMVRNLVGTFLEIGQVKRDPAEIGPILEARNRKAAGPTAPPEGLYLVRIWY